MKITGARGMSLDKNHYEGEKMKMNHLTKLLLVGLALGVMIVMSSCTKEEKTAVGAALGAGTGIAIGAATGGAGGAVAGGLIGGAVGGVAGHSMGDDPEDRDRREHRRYRD